MYMIKITKKHIKTEEYIDKKTDVIYLSLRSSQILRQFAYKNTFI